MISTPEFAATRLQGLMKSPRKRYYGNVVSERCRSLAFRKLKYRKQLIEAANNVDLCARRVDSSLATQTDLHAALTQARLLLLEVERPHP